MRIEFANATRDGLAWAGPLLRIGSAADNDLVLGEAGVDGHHLRLRRMAGSLVLEVVPGAGRVYVNARPVRERALLRAGDSLGVGECRLRLCADVRQPDDAGDEVEAAEAPLTVALRVVAGPLSGRVLPLDERVELGPRGHLPLELPHGEATLAVVRRDGALFLDVGGVPSGLAVFVNGLAASGAPLRDGDQIALGAHRFVIDAWVPSRTIVHARETFLPREADLPEDTAGPRGEVWWLIVTAAVLGLAIALLLFVRF